MMYFVVKFGGLVDGMLHDYWLYFLIHRIEKNLHLCHECSATIGIRFPSLLNDMLTVAGSRSAHPHIFRFITVTLIPDPTGDQTPLHPLSTGHRALWRQTDTQSHAAKEHSFCGVESGH